MDKKKKKQLEAWNRIRAKGTKKWLENRRKKALNKKPIRKVKKTKRIKLPSIKTLKNKADEVFSIWIRTRDSYKCVLADGRCKGGIQCGHLIKRRKMSTRWDEVNCHAICSHHNYLDNLEPQHYLSWFLREYGSLPYQDLVDKSKQTVKLTREYLQNIIKRYDT
jgi:hypothetical protein